MVGATKQDGLVHEPHAEFAILEDLLNDILGLGVAVLDRDVPRLATILAVREQILPVLPLALRDQAVGRIEYRLRRTIILLE